MHTNQCRLTSHQRSNALMGTMLQPQEDARPMVQQLRHAKHDLPPTYWSLFTYDIPLWSTSRITSAWQIYIYIYISGILVAEPRLRPFYPRFVLSTHEQRLAALPGGSILSQRGTFSVKIPSYELLQCRFETLFWKDDHDVQLRVLIIYTGRNYNIITSKWTVNICILAIVSHL